MNIYEQEEIGKIDFDTYKHVIERLKSYHNVENIYEVTKKAQIKRR